MTVPTLPRHSRPAPAEWEILLEYAHGQRPDEATWEQEGDIACKVYAVADLLPDEALAAARFYGLGEAMCLLARDLKQPDTRQEVVNQAAGILVALSKKAHGNLVVSQVRHDGLSEPFMAQAALSCRGLSPAVQVAADALGQIAQVRQEKRHLTIGMIEARGITSELTARTIGAAAVAGASTVLRLALQHQADQLDGEADPVNRLMRLIEPGDVTKLDQSLMRRLAINLARLRLDEFENNMLLRSLIVTDHAKLALNRDLLQTEPDHLTLETRERVLHYKRLGCPALFVEGLIPLVLSILTDATEQAAMTVTSQRA